MGLPYTLAACLSTLILTFFRFFFEPVFVGFLRGGRPSRPPVCLVDSACGPLVENGVVFVARIYDALRAPLLHLSALASDGQD